MVEFTSDQNKKEDYTRLSKKIDIALGGRDIDPEFIKKHLPKKDYMGVELKKAEIKSETDDNTVMTEQALALPLDVDEKLPEGEFELTDPKNPKKKYKIAIYDTVFRTNLHDLVQSQFYECPSTVFPVITERLVQSALNEQGAKYPEKRKELKDWSWLIVLIILPFLIILAISLF